MSATDPYYDVPCDMAYDTCKTALEAADSPFRFPPTMFDSMDDYDGISAQVHIVCEEAGEVASALRKEGPKRLAEEAWDVIHAAEGVLRRLENNGIDIAMMRNYVEDKNRERGLYVEDETTVAPTERIAPYVDGDAL